VKSECSKIRNNVYAELHAGFINTLFGCLPLNNPTVIEARSNHLFMYHRKKNDCRVLAEAEDLNFTVLLTFDTDLKNRLAVKANNVRLMKPTEFWAELSVPHNAKPLLLPHYTNPLSKQSFWRW
jgi:predicted nucleic acid-binding protein